MIFYFNNLVFHCKTPVPNTPSQ